MFPLRQWIPAAVIGGLYLVVLALILGGVKGDAPLETAVAIPAAFSVWIFRQGWLGVEIASMILLVALIGAFHIGRPPKNDETAEK
jgi:NADH-quinone oxidoreductase subunit J